LLKAKCLSTFEYVSTPEPDGKTLVPHLEALTNDLPDVVRSLTSVLADDAYREKHTAVERFGQPARLIVPVHGRTAHAALANGLAGIARFTPSGVPVCEGGHRFELRGRDIIAERYIWAAPDDDAGQPVCASCPQAAHAALAAGRLRASVTPG
jgi:hypothetical protein